MRGGWEECVGSWRVQRRHCQRGDITTVMAVTHSSQPFVAGGGRKGQTAEPLNMLDINRTLRNLRMLQWGLMAALLLFAGVAEMVCVPGNDDWNLKHWLITGMALWGVLGAFRLRRKLLNRSRQALTKDASDLKWLEQWEVGHVFSLTLAGGVATWGLLVRFVLVG